MSEPSKYLVVICGPTASGKSELALQLARHYKTEIVSTDSRQIYRELDIGTAKPGQTDLDSIKHHFISSISIHDNYSAGQYERDALEVLHNLYRQKDMVIAAGGTGLYIKAIIEGFDDIPETNPAVREAIITEYEEHGLQHLQKTAKDVDPESFAATDIQNPQRLMRLIEVYRSTGKPRSAFTLGIKSERPFQTLKIGLQLERDKLYDRINRRVDHMMENGLLEEVRSLHQYKKLNALQTVGYSELIEYLDGQISLEESIDLIKRNSRRYAKRQMTWFRKDSDIQWFEPAEIKAMISCIDSIVKS